MQRPCGQNRWRQVVEDQGDARNILRLLTALSCLTCKDKKNEEKNFSLPQTFHTPLNMPLATTCIPILRDKNLLMWITVLTYQTFKKSMCNHCQKIFYTTTIIQECFIFASHRLLFHSKTTLLLFFLSAVVLSL